MVGGLQRHLQHSNASKQVDQPRGNSHAQHQKRDAPLQRQNAVRDEGQRAASRTTSIAPGENKADTQLNALPLRFVHT